MSETTPHEHLIDDICSGDPAKVAAALQSAAPHRETLAPVLLARLMQAAFEPQLWTGDEGQPCPVFLPYLAAAWRLTDAHPLIVALLRLPPDDCNAVLGDFITEGAKRTLADTWPGDLRAIEALSLDAKAEPFARGAGLGAAAILCARGRISREVVLALLERCATLPLDPDAEDDSLFAGQIVSTTLDLNAWELRDQVSALFAQRLVDPTFCGDLDTVLGELRPDGAFNQGSYHFPPPITDAWETLRRWHFFSPSFPDRTARTSHPDQAAYPVKPTDKPVAGWQEGQQYRAPPKVGRNDPCPCGSGKKFKKCCSA